jgi:hypothetical protein
LGCAVRSSDQFVVALGYDRSIELLRRTGLPLKRFAHETEHLRILQRDKFGTSCIALAEKKGLVFQRFCR